MMKPEQTRAALLAALTELSRVRPEWRLGQTLANIATTAGRLDAGGVWDLEDDEALAAARELVRQCAAAERLGAKWPMSPSPMSCCPMPTMPGVRLASFQHHPWVSSNIDPSRRIT
jgi:hypothetical protein